MGKKSGPLAFLNKKTWHPGRIQNLEEVWKRQQEAVKEEQKLKEYAKQLQEERGREELAAVAEAAGHKIKADRLDWMYQGGLGQRQEADERNAAQEATAAAAAAPAETAVTSAPPGGAAPGPSLPSFYSEDTPASANEMWQRLHSDPLFAIKQQELAARKNIVANPVKMLEIKQQVKELKQLAGGKKEKKAKKEKKQKKEKRHKEKKRGRSSSPSSGGSDREAEPAGAKRQRSASPPRPAPPARGRPDEAPPPRQPEQHQQQHERNGRQYDRQHSRQYDRQPSRRYDEDVPRGGDRDREAYRRRGDDMHGMRDGAQRAERDGARRPRSRSRSRERGRGEPDRRGRDERRPRSRSRSRGRSGSRERGGRGPRGYDRQDRAPRRSRSRSRSRDRQQRGGAAEPRQQQQKEQQQQQQQKEQQQQQQKEEQQEQQEPAAAGRADVAVHVDGASAQGHVANYGINWASHVPEEARKADRSDFAEATRRRLEEAGRLKEREERDKAAQRYQRKEYRTGQLTAEEKQRRLAEMMGAAQEHEAERAQRLQRQAEKEAAEEDAHGARHHTDTATFLQAATKDVYGAAKGGSLEDTVGRRAYFNERGGGSGAAFRKNG